MASSLVKNKKEQDLYEFLAFLTLRSLLKKKKSLSKQEESQFIHFYQDIKDRMNSLHLFRLIFSSSLEVSDKKKIIKYSLFGA